MSLTPGAANFVKRIIFDPCTEDWWVYVETFIPAFIELWLTLSIIDLNDLVRARGYDVAGKNAKPTLKRARHGGLFIPSDDKGKVNRWSQKGLRTLLVLTEPLEKLGFLWLCYAAADQFFFRWTSMIMENGCNQPLPGFARRGTDIAFVPNEIMGGIGCPDLIYSRGGVSPNVFGSDLGPGTWELILVVECDGARPANESPYKAAFTITGAFPGGVQTASADNVGGGTAATLIIHETVWVPPGASASVAWGVQGPPVATGLRATSVRVQAIRTKQIF